MDSEWKIVPSDLVLLRELANRKAEIANDPVNLDVKRLWYELDAGRGERPMVLAESWVSFMDLPDSRVECHEEWAQDLERSLRFDLYQFEKVRDDHVVEPWMQCNWKVDAGNYGVASTQHYAERVSGNVSSRRWDPPIKDIQADFHKLQPRRFSVDREATFAWKQHIEEVFDGILGVRLRGGFWWTVGLTGSLIDLVGLDHMMEYMCTDPEGLHRMMAFLQADMMSYIDWLEEEGLLELNNENDYTGSGSIGYSNALPGADWQPGQPVRAKHLWTLAESQETVLVSPAQFHEFVFEYQKPIIARFGRCYYGCCEPVHTRWEWLKTLGNLNRLSVSPWCDQRFMAEALGRNYVFSRKPNPTLVSVPDFDEDLIRNDLRETLGATLDCNVEVIMKDVHTLCGEPERLARWVEIARETAAEFGY